MHPTQWLPSTTIVPQLRRSTTTTHYMAYSVVEVEVEVDHIYIYIYAMTI